MTRTQLQALSDAEFVSLCRNHFRRANYALTDLLAEAVQRLDDQFAFVSAPQPNPDQQELPS